MDPWESLPGAPVGKKARREEPTKSWPPEPKERWQSGELIWRVGRVLCLGDLRFLVWALGFSFLVFQGFIWSFRALLKIVDFSGVL